MPGKSFDDKQYSIYEHIRVKGSYPSGLGVKGHRKKVKNFQFKNSSFLISIFSKTAFSAVKNPKLKKTFGTKLFVIAFSSMM